MLQHLLLLLHLECLSLSLHVGVLLGVLHLLLLLEQHLILVLEQNLLIDGLSGGAGGGRARSGGAARGTHGRSPTAHTVGRSNHERWLCMCRSRRWGQ